MLQNCEGYIETEIMEIHQESEWLEAQSIVLSPDLVAAAKQQLLFLAEVDRNRCLYDGPILNRAIFRYTLMHYVNITIIDYLHYSISQNKYQA